MSKALSIQGTIFCGLAGIVAALSLVLPRLEPRLELIIIASLIILLGLPHGAMDTVFAKSIYKVNGLLGWVIFGIIYIVIAAVVVGIWLLAPMLFLLGFLAISVAHFSGDQAEGTNIVSRLLYGGAAIVLPTLFHQQEVEHLFLYLAGGTAATSVTAGLSWLAWPWAVALLCSAFFELRKNQKTGFELMAVTALAILASPLIGFTIFFCAMHSARHILRTFNYARGISPWMVVEMSILPMLAVMITIIIGWNLFASVSFDTRLIQITFVGLAALTVPHMALVEHVRLTGWAKGQLV